MSGLWDNLAGAVSRLALGRPMRPCCSRFLADVQLVDGQKARCPRCGTEWETVGSRPEDLDD